MTYNDLLLDVIDQRISAATIADTAVGTVTFRSKTTTDRTAMVTFDGSSVAVPVKVLATADIDVGDRVCLNRYGTDWVVVGGFTRHLPGAAVVHTLSPSGSTTSATAVDLPGTPQATFVKRWDDTRVVLAMTSVVYVNTITNPYTAVQLWLEFVGAASYAVAYLEFGGTTFEPSTVAGYRPVDSGVGLLPAGTYTVKGKWARVAGTATLSQDTLSLNSFAVWEVGP
jgi:hypothetical protein